MRGLVYEIRSHQSELVYYGSTSQTLSQRMAEHRKAYRRHLVGKGDWISSFQLMCFEDAYISLCRVVEYEIKSELHAVEGEFIRGHPCVNKIQLGRTHQQYYKDNRDNRLTYQTQYTAEHKEQIAQLAKEQNTCACGAIFRHDGKADHLRTKKHQRWLRSVAI
jgi:hypothetical protein